MRIFIRKTETSDGSLPPDIQFKSGATIHYTVIEGSTMGWALALKLSNFLKKPFYQKLNSVTSKYWQLKTVVFYKTVFGSMGRGCIICRPMLLENPQFIHLGESVHIREGVRLEAVVQNSPRIPRLSIGNNVNIEQNVHIVCQSRIYIGNNVSITGNCAIVDTTHPYQDVHDPTKIGSRILDEDSFVEIGDGCFIGFCAMIMPNVSIGNYCVIGAHSVVTKDVPDYSVVAGNPATLVRRYDPKSETWEKVAKGRATSEAQSDRQLP
jgi:acetyltransferase-like isoleucine patch superfamily enzyme